MTFNNAFPSSPLSRSALRGDTSLASLMTDSPSEGTQPPEDSPVTTSKSPRLPSSPPSSWSRHLQWSASSPTGVPYRSVSASTPSSSRTPPSRTARRASHHFSTSPTPNLSFVGSYSESLLSGRMSMNPSAPFPFQAELGVLGKLHGEAPAHLRLDFDACFYAASEGLPSGGASISPQLARSLGAAASRSNLPSMVKSPPSDLSSAPYVGTVDLEAFYISDIEASIASSSSSMPAVPPLFPGYAVPAQGQIQLMVRNPQLNSPVKLFLVPYDLRDMPAGTKTFVRQKIFVEQPLNRPTEPSVSNIGSRNPKRYSMDAASSISQTAGIRSRESLRYAIHLQFIALPAPNPRKRGRKTTEDFETAQHPSGSSEELHRPVRYFLHKSIRLVFSPRPPDKEESTKTYVETPAGLILQPQPRLSKAETVDLTGSQDNDGRLSPSIQQLKERQKRYSSCSTESEEWTSARRQIMRIRKEWKAVQSGRRAVSHDPIGYQHARPGPMHSSIGAEAHWAREPVATGSRSTSPLPLLAHRAIPMDIPPPSHFNLDPNGEHLEDASMERRISHMTLSHSPKGEHRSSQALPPLLPEHSGITRSRSRTLVHGRSLTTQSPSRPSSRSSPTRGSCLSRHAGDVRTEHPSGSSLAAPSMPLSISTGSPALAATTHTNAQGGLTSPLPQSPSGDVGFLSLYGGFKSSASDAGQELAHASNRGTHDSMSAFATAVALRDSVPTLMPLEGSTAHPAAGLTQKAHGQRDGASPLLQGHSRLADSPSLWRPQSNLGRDHGSLNASPTPTARCGPQFVGSLENASAAERSAEYVALHSAGSPAVLDMLTRSRSPASNSSSHVDAVEVKMFIRPQSPLGLTQHHTGSIRQPMADRWGTWTARPLSPSCARGMSRQGSCGSAHEEAQR